MKFYKILSIIFLTGMILPSCESLLEPMPDNIYDDDRVLNDAPFAEGILLRAYSALPSSYNFNETAATDDAVSNVEELPYTRMALGEWSSQFNPASTWESSYEQLYYLNLFLRLVPDIEWSWESEVRNELFRDRFTGEAMALRAWYNFELLKNHGGVTEAGDALGFVILTPELISDVNDDLTRLPRNSYDACVAFILDDLEQAIELLPGKYEDTEDINYTRVFGAQNENRVNGTAAKALKARVLLHAASQAFNTGVTFEDAANAAANILKEIGGPAGMSPSGFAWYNDENDPDIIWRRDFVTNNAWEQLNYPPSLFGNGLTNPTQNLVEAFPMANGYPIESGLSEYDENDPYANRDPRLSAYIVYNGNVLRETPINTSTTGGNDGINSSQNATRTGYYMKKLMNEEVNLDPNINSVQIHFYTFFRYTEMFLIYAEAANEAWGPEADPMGHGFTARDVVAALRERAGITQPDAYLASVASVQNDMRELIRNERRIELSFEGFRFWDLRRWGLDLSTSARGMRITGTTHTVVNVENRAYQPYMIYGPIPFDEILRDENLTQNAGW